MIAEPQGSRQPRPCPPSGPPPAFSLTDVSAIKRWAKLLMMIEAMVSLGIGVLVVARAVSILK